VSKVIRVGVWVNKKVNWATYGLLSEYLGWCVVGKLMDKLRPVKDCGDENKTKRTNKYT
jgi:hypothetical protein